MLSQKAAPKLVAKSSVSFLLLVTVNHGWDSLRFLPTCESVMRKISNTGTLQALLSDSRTLGAAVPRRV